MIQIFLFRAFWGTETLRNDKNAEIFNTVFLFFKDSNIRDIFEEGLSCILFCKHVFDDR